jgi:hypothetical protein
MTLKSQMAADLEDGAVWFSVDDFAERHNVNGADVLCELGAASGRPEKVGRMSGGAYTSSSYVFIRARDFGRPPKPNEPIIIDGEKFRITGVKDDLGAYVIEYRRWDDDKLRSPGA